MCHRLIGLDGQDTLKAPDGFLIPACFHQSQG